MSVNLIFKIAAVGILVTVISQVLKHSGREEHAFLTSLAGLLIVLFWIVPYIYDLFETMKSLFSLWRRNMDIIQVGLLGITAVFLALFIKNYKSEYSILISIVACICIFIFLIGKLELVLSYINSVVELIPVDGRYLAMILKMIGITYVAEFATDICRESGYQAIAGQIEIFAKLSILLISMPVLMGFIETLGAFL